MAPARKRAKTTPPPDTAAALTPNAKNPRLPWKDEKQSDAFAKSLAEFGDLSGVVFNLATGRLVGGHKRVEAFKASGNPDITRTHELASPDASGTVAYGFAVLESGVRFSYREVSWSESKESAALLAANRWGAEWSWEGVSEIVKELDGLGSDMSLTGFTLDELEPLLQAEWSPPQAGDMPSHPQGAEGVAPKHYTLTLTGTAHTLLASYCKANGGIDPSTAIERLCAEV
jgi:hypothetical protein